MRAMGRMAAGELPEGTVAFVAPEGDVPRGDHLVARLPGADSDEKPALLLGHLDTVWPIGTLERIPWSVDGEGVARGPGVFDMKAGLVQTIWALRALEALGVSPRRPITIVWNADEEVGSVSSRSLIEREAQASGVCLVMEPSLPGGGAKTFRRGVGMMRVEVEGRAAHAGLDPENGINAICELAPLLGRAAALSDPPSGVTVNVGLVRGGSRTNVVPARAAADLDVRMDDPGAGEELLGKLRALRAAHPEARTRWTGGVNRPPLVRTEGVARLYGVARAAARELDWDLPEGPAGGGSDGNIVAGVGVAVLDGLGPAGDGAHAAHEHVRLDDLPRRTALLALLLQRL